MPRKRLTTAESVAVVALFINLPAKARRLTLQWMWDFMPKSERAAPTLRVARPFAPKDIKAQIRAAARAGKGGA